MPKILRARPAQDEQEERQVRKLAASRHGPADWIVHARIVAKSWDGERVEEIARTLQCSPQTVRRRLHRFDTAGFEGLGDRPRPGRPRRLTHADDSALIALVHTPPPGRLVTQRDGTLVARKEEKEAKVGASQLWRRRPKTPGSRSNAARSDVSCARKACAGATRNRWAEPRDKDFAPKERRSSATT
jgi:transposase